MRSERWIMEAEASLPSAEDGRQQEEDGIIHESRRSGKGGPPPNLFEKAR